MIESGVAWRIERPKVRGAEEPASPEVQALCLILGAPGRFRRVVVGGKHLPRGAGARTWALVDLVSAAGEALLGDLIPRSYETRTRGARVQDAGRVVGSGPYRIEIGGGETRMVLGAGAFVVLAKPPKPPIGPREHFRAATVEVLDREGAQLILIAASR